VQYAKAVAGGEFLADGRLRRPQIPPPRLTPVLVRVSDCTPWDSDCTPVGAERGLPEMC